jgi:hypothetical protein
MCSERRLGCRSQTRFDTPSVREMTQANGNTSPEINEVGVGQEGELALPKAQEGEFLKRARRRRLDLRSLAGTLRESARIYRELAEGRINASQAEVRSRVLRRHHEILAALEQQRQLAGIQEQLSRLTGKPLNSIEITPVADQEPNR